ncbi:protein FAM131A isoform X2 [Carassius gibelio]|uniref:protein FAM131A isoform X2 n=1 Tax=Carassius gibelio TaxID=101364 RepID=UPI00227908E8|nr:protein FAM131A isoform X2 [Carassius gibelio]
MLYPCAMLLTALPQLNLKVDDPTDMLPKSRKALSIQEIAALARSSFNGISQVVKDHVTKPTAMAQGRVAHLIEWKGWSKPLDPPSATLQSHFNSYSHLSEGEQEARFAAGVAEQFAIAEAKLRAWTSVDEEEMDEESYEEDPPLNDEPITTTLSSGEHPVSSNQSSPVPSQTDTAEISLSDPDEPLISEEVPPHAQELQLSEGEGDRATCGLHKPERRPLWSKGDSCYYSTSYSESGLSPEDQEEEDGREVEEGEDNVFQEVIRWYRHCRSISDTSGAVSFDDEEEEEEEEEQEDGSKQ